LTTKLGLFCDKVLEAGWLMAVVLVPLFFNVYSSRVFEPDKLTLLRSIALLMVAAWLIKILEASVHGAQGGNPSNDEQAEAAGRERRSLREWLTSVPLVLPTLALVLLYIVSTAASVVPGVSLFGSYQRLQGTYTTFSYVVIFFMLIQGLRQREQLDRLITAVLLSSMSVSLYGIIQHDKLDPLPWGGDVTSRVAANMGNAIFVAAYLVMTLPLALYRLVENLTAIADPDRPRQTAGFIAIYLVLLMAQFAVWLRFGFVGGLASGLGTILIVILGSLFLDRPITRFALLGAYSFILVAQTVTILFSQSRGPWLGLLAGLYVFVLLALTLLRRQAADQSPLSRQEVLRAIGFAVASSFVGIAPAYAVMAALRKGIRWLWISWLVQALVGIALIIGISLPNTPLSALHSLPYIGRLGNLFDQGGTNAVRVLIWQGAVQLVEPHTPLSIPPDMSDPLNFLRPIIGYGPESMYVAYNRFYQADLAHFEARNASPDRSHNETFDSLITTGVLGLLVYMTLFGSVFYYGLRCLCMVNKARDRWVYIGLWVGGSILGALITCLADHSLRFFGVGLPAGSVVGLAIYVALYSFVLYERSETWSTGTDSVGLSLSSEHLVVTSLLAAIVAHFIEIQVGIAIAASRTHFWVYAGALVAICYYFRQRTESSSFTAPASVTAAVEAVKPKPTPESGPSRTLAQSRRPGASTKPGAVKRTPAAVLPTPRAPSRTPAALPAQAEHRPVSALLAVYGVLVSIILITMTFDFVTRTFDVSAGNYSMMWLFLVTWLISTVIALSLAAEGRAPGEDPSDWIRGTIAYLLISLGAFLIFWLIYGGLLHASPSGQGLAAIMEIAGEISSLLILFYAVMGVLMLLLALALYRRAEPRNGITWQFRNWWIYPPLVVVVLWVVLTTNIQVILADMVYKQALPYDDRQEYDASLPLYQRTIQLAPTQDFYYLFLGRAYLEKAQRTADAQQRDALMNSSRDALLKALALNPMNTDHSANLARLYRAWGGLITVPADRQRLLEQAYAYYQQATSLSPQNAQLWNETGLVAYFLGHYDDAAAKYEHSIQLDPTFADTFVFLGDAYQALNKPDEALKAHLKALELNASALTDPRLFSLPINGFQDRRFDFYAKAGTLDQITAALRNNPALDQDAGINTTLAGILMRQGNLDQALAYYNKAAQINPNDLATHLAIGYIDAQQKRFDAALAEFQRCVAIAPNDLVSHRNLGGILRQLNRLDEARVEFEKALAITPDDLVTIQNLADVYRLMNRPQDALTQIQHWVDLSPQDYSAHQNWSMLYRDLQRVTEAITQAQKAIELAPEAQKPALQQYLKDLEGQKATP
jgi:tetratricopeptide (TPR) repeat protein